MSATAAPAATPRGRRFVAALALVTPLLGPSPAAAQTGLDAAAIRDRVQAVLQSYVEESGGALQPQGEVTVTRQGDDVVLSLPPMLVAEQEDELRVPGTTLHLRQEGPDRIAFRTTLPMPLQGLQAGAQVFALDVASQQLAGIYRPSLLTFERFDLELAELRAITPEGEALIGSFRVEAGLTESQSGLWDAVAGLQVSDVYVRDPQRQPQASIGLIDMRWTLKHYRQAELSALQRRIYGDNPFSSLSTDPQVQAAPMLEMLQRLSELFAGASGDMTFTLGGLKVESPDAPFSLGRLGFSLALAPQEADTYDLRLGFGADGPEVADGALPLPPTLLPRRADFAAEIKRIPLAALWQAFVEPMIEAAGEELRQTGELSPETEQMLEEHVQLFPFMAMEQLAEAGSFAELKQLELAIGPSTLTARGVGPLQPDNPDPPLRIEATIAGLDDLAAEIQSLDPAQQEEIMPFIVMLRGLGATAVRDGKVVHTYLLEQAPDGRITVNGVGLDEVAPQ